MGLLKNVMVLADCDEFTAYTKSIYFASKSENKTVRGYITYLDTTESKHRNIYRKGKWLKKDLNPDSAFVGDNDAGRGGDG